MSHEHQHIIIIIITYHFIFWLSFDSSSEFIPPAGSGDDVNKHEGQPGVDDTPDWEGPSRGSDFGIVVIGYSASGVLKRTCEWEKQHCSKIFDQNVIFHHL